MYTVRYLLFLVLSVLYSCNHEVKVATKGSSESPPLFKLLTAETSGIDFENTITETTEINYFTYPYLFMGGGVGIGDFNNDGLEDIFFTANQESNRLYINQGNLKFQDISQNANIQGDNRWYTGVSIVDINADGFLDIYLSVAGRSGDRTNELYLNNGDLTFTESAQKYGVADGGYSYQGTFFDYDVDGDLDLLVINYPPTNFNAQPRYYKQKNERKVLIDSDRLYENVDGKYIDVTKSSGLANFGLTISASVSDFNNDGYQDIYLNNDFGSPDFLYLNNKDKTFKEVSKEATNHTAMYSMGSDHADFNRDGFMDFVQLDMNPADNYRNKVNMASMNIPLFWAQVDNGLHYQYMHNMLQLNSGIIDGVPQFSDVSQLAGISSTDWSWSVLALDVDNDAHQDIFVTNGTKRDINNRDFFKNLTKGLAFASPEKKLKESKKMPSNPISNYLFRNRGDLQFEDISGPSGIAEPSFSNGMAYGDLDNDGDLDLVVNNIDKTAFIYENTTSELVKSNFLKVKLKGTKNNPNGIGSKLKLISGSTIQTLEQMPMRGFQSTVSNTLHFGLGNLTEIDSLVIMWPDGKTTLKNKIKANQTLNLDYGDAPIKLKDTDNLVSKLFKKLEGDKNSLSGLVHTENKFDDFRKQILLPHKMSQFGPAMCVADFNNDNLDDIYFGASAGSKSNVYLQQESGTFEQSFNPVFEVYMDHEDVDALAFDFDGDNDLDIYVVSGGNEFEPNDSRYQDRLYLNDGDGKFSDGTNKIPKNNTSGSVVKAMDFDNDGDLDVFVGTRHLPHNYPLSERSFVYENENGHFKDVTEQIAPDLIAAGMVTDVVWVDLNLDENIDLVVVGEWMQPLLLLNNGERFEKANNADFGLNNMHGWWYSIETNDLDNDGDMDLILGNLGDNYKYQANLEKPFKVFAKDFNNSGNTDIVLSYAQNDNYYPVRGKQCSSEQLPILKEKFEDYESFASADVEAIYDELGLEDAIELTAETFSSYLLKNNNGVFEKQRLPSYAQISSINDILIEDFNNNGQNEILIAGNLYTSEVETTRNDASYGTIITTSENLQNIEAKMPSETGLFIKGDCKQLAQITISDKNYIIAAVNDGQVILHEIQ